MSDPSEWSLAIHRVSDDPPARLSTLLSAGVALVAGLVVTAIEFTRADNAAYRWVAGATLVVGLLGVAWLPGLFADRWQAVQAMTEEALDIVARTRNRWWPPERQLPPDIAIGVVEQIEIELRYAQAFRAARQVIASRRELERWLAGAGE